MSNGLELYGLCNLLSKELSDLTEAVVNGSAIAGQAETVKRAIDACCDSEGRGRHKATKSFYVKLSCGTDIAVGVGDTLLVGDGAVSVRNAARGNVHSFPIASVALVEYIGDIQ